MPRYTPGPWKVVVTEYKRGSRLEIMREGWSEVIANVHKSGMCNGYRYHLPAEANARIMAKAPQLQELCEIALPLLESYLRSLQQSELDEVGYCPACGPDDYCYNHGTQYELINIIGCIRAAIEDEG